MFFTIILIINCLMVFKKRIFHLPMVYIFYGEIVVIPNALAASFNLLSKQVNTSGYGMICRLIASAAVRWMLATSCFFDAA